MHTPFSAGRISAGSMADSLPLLTAAVSFALTALLLRQYLNRRKLHQLVWTASLGLLGLAAVLAYLGNADVVGWDEAPSKGAPPRLSARGRGCSPCPARSCSSWAACTPGGRTTPASTACSWPSAGSCSPWRASAGAPGAPGRSSSSP